MEKIDKKIEYQEFLENDLNKYIKEYQEIKVFKLVVSEHFKELLFCNNKCAEFKLKGFAVDTDGKNNKRRRQCSKHTNSWCVI